MRSKTSPTTGEWPGMLNQRARVVRSLARADVPDQPGVYLWQRRGELQYVGKATSRRDRLWGNHLGRGTTLSGSSLRRNVAELLFGIPPTVTGKPLRQPVTKEQAVAIADWLLACELSWRVCASSAAAGELEKLLLETWRPPLNRA